MGALQTTNMVTLRNTNKGTLLNIHVAEPSSVKGAEV